MLTHSRTIIETVRLAEFMLGEGDQFFDELLIKFASAFTKT